MRARGQKREESVAVEDHRCQVRLAIASGQVLIHRGKHGMRKWNAPTPKVALLLSQRFPFSSSLAVL